jgi:Fcf2 pre-rRNA processing
MARERDPKHRANDEGPGILAGRLTKKQRKNTLTEELLADEELNRLRKKRYNALQEEASRWSHKKGKKTDQPRIKRRSKPRR